MKWEDLTQKMRSDSEKWEGLTQKKWEGLIAKVEDLTRKSGKE